MSIRKVRYRRSPATLARTVGDDVLLAAADRDGMKLLSGTAGAVWRLLAAPRTVEELVDRLQHGFAASAATMRADVRDLLRRLEASGWIEQASDADG